MAEVKRLLTFVKEFMRSSRGGEVDRAPIDVHAWFRSLADHWAGHPHGDKVAVNMPDEAFPAIEGDTTLLTALINNLVLNGIEASEGDDPAPPWVTVSAEDHGDEVLVVVGDKGSGFTPEIRKKMFIPFVSSKEHGTGLGLFHCRRIMLEHHGHLEVAPDLPTRILCHFPKN
jgi:signal transduction histidine kinase